MKAAGVGDGDGVAGGVGGAVGAGVAAVDGDGERMAFGLVEGAVESLTDEIGEALTALDVGRLEALDCAGAEPEHAARSNPMATRTDTGR